MKPMVPRPAGVFSPGQACLVTLLGAVAAMAQSSSNPPPAPPPVPPTPATSAVQVAIPPGPSRPLVTPQLQLNNPNREALEAPFRGAPGTVPGEPSSALLRQPRSSFSLRSMAEAINPLAPIPSELKKVRYAHELSRPIDHAYPRSLRDPLTPGLPRAFQDPITHEPSLRLW